MAVSAERYNQLAHLIATNTIDLDTGPFKLMLVTSAYTFDATNTQKADLVANEVSGTGYIAGGETLTGVTVTQTTSTTTMDANDVTWSAATITARRAILYASGTFGGLTDPVLMSYLLDDTPADVSTSGVDFIVQWNASGIVTLG